MKDCRSLLPGPQVRLNVENSIFLAEARETEREEEVRIFLEEVRRRTPDATHHCSAYRLEDREGADDDGEPSGTAGLPILHALKKHGLSNLTLVITRYFGGRKLGVRGLIEAYGTAAEACIATGKPVLRRAGMIYEVETDYAFGGQLLNPKLHKEIEVLERQFGEAIRLKLFVSAGELPVYESLFGEKGVKILRREAGRR